MKIELKKDRYEVESYRRTTYIHAHVDVRVNHVIKQVGWVKSETETIYCYYLCYPIALDKDDLRVYGAGAFLGESVADLRNEDIVFDYE